MRDSAKWEYDAGQNANEQKTRLTIAALESQAAENDSRRDQLQKLGEFAYKIWDNWGK